ncbi:MAG: LytTR family DNA-binding domain-containing protein [Bacteroidales bacterium]|nr:LytTR family DNA-binding domain-containing protein [Bacteroidales bacterium]
MKRPLRNLYLVVLVGVVLSIGHYFFQGKESFLQVLLIQVFTAFNIGFPLMIIIFNKHTFYGKRSRLGEIALLLLSFAVLALLASELENIFRFFIRNHSSYSPFSNPEFYLANTVITSVLGFTFYYVSDAPTKSGKVSPPPFSLRKPATRLDRIPVRYKRETLLVELDSVLYIEAYDNYAFVFRTNGEKLLCNYSLGYMEPVLDHAFIRIHRKHLVNKQKIRSLSKHTHKRYKVRLNDDRTELVSSAGYSEQIRELLEI